MIKKKPETQGIQIDLDGPQGNAFNILGIASKLGKQLGKTPDELKKIQEDMTSGDYRHLIEVFENHYGKYVVMYSSRELQEL